MSDNRQPPETGATLLGEVRDAIRSVQAHARQIREDTAQAIGLMRRADGMTFFCTLALAGAGTIVLGLCFQVWQLRGQVEEIRHALDGVRTIVVESPDDSPAPPRRPAIRQEPLR